MRLTRKWNEFKNDVEGYIKQAITIEQSFLNSDNKENLNNLNEEYKKWQDSVVEYLSSSFDESNNDYAQSIKYPQNNRYNIGNTRKDVSQLIKQKLDDLSSLRKSLIYYLRVLNISDAIVRPDEIDLEERKNYSTDEILELILEKLYELYDDSYHPISNIISGNGIELKRFDEDRLLAKTLENYGYVNLMSARFVSAQLTLEGKRYIENRAKKEVTDYSKIDKSQDELNAKIDNIIETLNKQNLGQEILFEELEELKELYSKLNKKNWGQVLKGKLIDLGLAQVINKDVMESIFKELTDQLLRLK